jgi:hypothetical protein
MLDVIRAISHSLRTRLLAAALLLPLVALSVASGSVGLRCRITGEMLSACCCDRGENDAAKAESVATVSQAECCDRVVREVASTPANVSESARALPEPVALVTYVAFEAPPAELVPSALSVRSEARASIGPPSVRLRLVAKSAFLI